MKDTRKPKKDLGDALRRVLTAAREVEEAVEMRDWRRAEHSNASLYSELRPLDRFLTATGSKTSHVELGYIAECLKDVMERHERAAAKLNTARTDAVAALQTLRNGRRRAAGYLAAADA